MASDLGMTETPQARAESKQEEPIQKKTPQQLIAEAESKRKKAEEIRDKALKVFIEKNRQARELLKGAEERKPSWWEFGIPFWNLEALVSGSWALLAANTASTLMKTAATDLNTAFTEAGDLENKANLLEQEAKRR